MYACILSYYVIHRYTTLHFVDRYLFLNLKNSALYSFNILGIFYYLVLNSFHILI